MFRVKPSFSAPIVIATSTWACSVAVDLEELRDRTCGPEEKACASECVALDNPNFGCGVPSCTPCSVMNAVSTCDTAGRCRVASCQGSHRDCNGRPDDGCEVDVDRDPDNCGACDAEPCELPNVDRTGCRDGRCSVLLCVDGFGDCDDVATNGCETALGTDDRCGRCSEACGDGQTCVAYECVESVASGEPT